jgi:hypothetical protein
MMQVTNAVEQSLRLRRLEEAVKANDRHALETFWREVAE